MMSGTGKFFRCENGDVLNVRKIVGLERHRKYVYTETEEAFHERKLNAPSIHDLIVDIHRKYDQKKPWGWKLCDDPFEDTDRIYLSKDDYNRMQNEIREVSDRCPYGVLEVTRKGEWIDDGWDAILSAGNRKVRCHVSDVDYEHLMKEIC